MTEAQKSKTIQIEAGTPAVVTIENAGDNSALESFEESRNIKKLLPRIIDTLAKYDTKDQLNVTVKIKGINPEDGTELEMVLQSGNSEDVIAALERKNITNDEAVVASTSFFRDMMDMVDVKAVMFVGVFEEGQASYILTNRTTEVRDDHMFRLVSTTLMQLDKLKEHMIATGVKIPGDPGGLVVPGQAGFQNTLEMVKKRG